MKIENVIEYQKLDNERNIISKLYSVCYENDIYMEYNEQTLPEEIETYMYYAIHIIENGSNGMEREFIYFN